VAVGSVESVVGGGPTAGRHPGDHNVDRGCGPRQQLAAPTTATAIVSLPFRASSRRRRRTMYRLQADHPVLSATPATSPRKRAHRRQVAGSPAPVSPISGGTETPRCLLATTSGPSIRQLRAAPRGRQGRLRRINGTSSANTCWVDQCRTVRPFHHCVIEGIQSSTGRAFRHGHNPTAKRFAPATDRGSAPLSFGPGRDRHWPTSGLQCGNAARTRDTTCREHYDACAEGQPQTFALALPTEYDSAPIYE